MNKNSILKFGKHRGRTIEEVWTGRIEIDESKVIRAYLQELLNFFAGERHDHIKIPSSRAELNGYEAELKLIVLDTPPLKIYVSHKYIVLETNDRELLYALNKVIKKILSSSFLGAFDDKPCWVSPNKPIENESVYSKNSKEFINLQADPDYIKWCIDCIDDFYINPEDIEELELNKSYSFSKFELVSIRDDIIEFKPVFVEFKYELPEKIKIKNQEKFNLYEPLTVDTDYDNTDYDIDFYFDHERSSLCGSCQESPCMCSDPEQTSREYNF